MSLNRRSFLGSAAGAGALSLLPEYGAFAQKPQLSAEQLEQAAEPRVLNVESIERPVIIESIELLRSGREYFVHVRSKDGAEGISVTNSRATYLYPILNRLVILSFNPTCSITAG